MKVKTASLLKYAVLAAFLAACVLSVLSLGKVAINYNISDYLAEETETKISLEILEDEFGLTSDIQVVAQNISVETALELRDEIEAIADVLAVNFDEYDENYYKDGNALFSVLVDGDEYSDTAAAVLSDIDSALSDFQNPTSLDGTVADKVTLRTAIEGEIPFILAVSLCLVTVIMLFTAQSWLEPLVLLASSGVAVLINMGTNALLGEISYITNAVGAILQLALSVDYSIVLLHGYRALKETAQSREKAMMQAIREVVKPVSASALTTIAGLLALLFMSFRIGFDIGTVLMKGIVISALTSLTLFPALLLIFDRILEKTSKKALVLTGKKFCNFAFRAGRVIVPIALLLIVACGILHSRNAFAFTDSDGSSGVAAEVFGENNSVIVVYPNGTDNHEKETLLADTLAGYKTADGAAVLENYTAYSNTVRELYDVQLAARKLDLPEEDVQLLLALYHINRDPSVLALKPLDFVRYANELLTNDADTADFTDEANTRTIRTLLVVDEVMNGAHTPEQFHSLLTTGVLEGTQLDMFSVMQMYGLYHYNAISDPAAEFETMLDFMIAASATDAMGGMFQPEMVAGLTELSMGIKQFNAQMDSPMTAKQFQGYMYETFGMLLDDATLQKIFYGYYALQGDEAQETIPFHKLMGFLVAQNLVADPNAVAAFDGYQTLYAALHTSYTYEQFLPALTRIAAGLSGQAPAIAATELSVQQVYIAYFHQVGKIPGDAIPGRDFVQFVKETAAVNPIVQAQLSETGAAKLSDLLVSDAFLRDAASYDYTEMTAKLGELKDQMQSVTSTAALDSDKISGIYVKYAAAKAPETCAAVEAKDLLDYVCENMDTNALLNRRLDDDMRGKVDEARQTVTDATDLFVGENYSRMLLSVALPNEGEETSRFVEFLTAQVREIFGSDAHIAGGIVATYDLQESFARDNTFITIFTIISIFVIVMLVFRSISLPVVLVAIIQGAIWISMSTSLLTGPMFFMSYIVSTCILMGATIDYGILMSTNYVQYRMTLSREEALRKSVAAAMPTVFTSGLILTICGFVVGQLSSQASISSVGTLLGKGTLVSVVMITLVLPSVLYLLDGFILKLSLKKK